MLSVSYPVRPWLHDHRFAGRAIFPAVEAMRVAAAAYARLGGDAPPPGLRNARFLHLIAVDAGTEALDFQAEAAGNALTLFLRKRLPGGMSRLVRALELEWAESGYEADAADCPPCPDSTAARRITAERIYEQLVPFGPAFRSLQGELALSGDTGFGRVLALPTPDAPELAGAAFLGAPLPLDGAMHAACVHGQQFADFVPFPVSFALRRIARPIQTGESCEVRLRLARRSADMLRYDLWLLCEGLLCEEVRGLEMRDVSGGRVRPPAWWRTMAAEGTATAGQPLEMRP